MGLSLFPGGKGITVDPPVIEPARPISFISLEASSDIVEGHWSCVELDSYRFSLEDIPERTFVRLDGGFSFPYHAVVRSHYGYRRGRSHNGVDIPVPTGTEVTAAFDGTVRLSTYHRGYGNIIIIRHANGIETAYAHLSSRKVSTGDKVSAGDVIALSGSTGRSTGPHLHFETMFCGRHFDPELIVDCESGTLVQSPFMLRRGMLR